MRIISKFKDYYDGGLAHGQDDAVTYVRQTRVTVRRGLRLGNFEWEDELAAMGAPLPILGLRKDNKLRGRDWAGHGAVFLGGKAYPFYVALKPDVVGRLAAPAREPVAFSWDKDFNDLVDDKLYGAGALEALEKRTGQDAPRANLEHHSPVVVMMPGGHWPYADDLHLPRVIVDARLADLNFQRVVDPYTAFQEIAMFVGGVLAETGDPPSPQTDKEKVASHGFDPKYGFRKPPAK